MRVGEGLSSTKVLIASVTARDSVSATGQLIETLFKKLESITTLSLHAGHPPTNRLYPSLLFRRHRLYSVYKAVREFEPDVIYVRPTLKPLLFNLFVLVLIVAQSPKVILHIMDDEANDITNGGVFKRLLFSQYLGWLMRRADQIFTISPGMSEAFLDRYGRDSQPLSNIPAAKPPSEIGKLKRGSTLKIGYFGSLNVRMNLRCVEEICKVIEKLNEKDFSVNLDIFTRSAYQQWADNNFNFRHTKVNAYVPSEDYLDTLRSYDVLLIAYNFDPISIEYCRYSIANKLADYISTGAAVLTVGPESVETVSLCKRYGIGITISNGYSTLQGDFLNYVELLRSTETMHPDTWQRHRKALRLDEAMAAWSSAF